MSAALLPVSVVIGSRNRPRLLVDTIASICDGLDKPTEIVVVDQSDRPEPPAIGNTAVDIRFIQSETRGLSCARNVGAAAARCPLIAFTDDDMSADRGWLRALIGKLLLSRPSIVATGRVTAGSAEAPGGFVPSTVNRPNAATFSGRLSIDVLAGGNMAMYRADFLRLGGFDSRLGAGSTFPAAEDNDLGYRLLEAGFTIVYVPDAVLIHRAWRPMNEYFSLRFAYGRGKGAFYLKHARAQDWHMIRRLTADLSRRPQRALRLIPQPRLAAGEIVYAAGLLLGAGQWMLRRGDLPDHLEAVACDELIDSRSAGRH